MMKMSTRMYSCKREISMPPDMEVGRRKRYLPNDEDEHLGYIDDEERDIKGVPPLLDNILITLQWDCCNELVCLIRDRRILDSLNDLGCRFPSSLLMKWAIFFGATRCVEALISGEIGIRVNVDASMNEIDPAPVYQAITMFSPEILNLFSKYGARLDLPCKSGLSGFHLMLPMEAALYSLREKISWTPTESVYELILTLCSSQELKQGLLTLSQLMRALPVEQTQKAIYQNARDGKIVELTILLYTDAISELGTFEGLEDKYLELRQSSATDAISPGTGSADGSALLLLLEIFKNTDFSMLGFSVVRGVLEKRIKKAGFELTSLQNSDNLNEAPEVVKCIKPAVDHPCGVADKRMLGFKTVHHHPLEKRSNNAGPELTNLQDLHEATKVIEYIKPMVDWPLVVFGKRARMEIGQQRTLFAQSFHAKRTISSFGTFQASYAKRAGAATHKGLAHYSLRRTLPVLASALRRLHV